MKLTAMTAAIAAIRDYGDDLSDYDILAKIVEAVEATADELAADEPTATATIETWRRAASALADIANELPDDWTPASDGIGHPDDICPDCGTPEHIVDAMNASMLKRGGF